MYWRVKAPLVRRRTPVGLFIPAPDGTAIEVDDTVIRALELCDGTHTTAAIVAALLGLRPEPQDGAAVEGLLAAMKAEGLVEEGPSPAKATPFYQGDRPLAMVVEITYACNQACLFCLRPTGREPATRLPDEAFLALAGEAARLGVSPVNITGGEPLLKAPLVLAMARRLSDAGCSAHLLTNAALVTGELARELKAAGVHSAQVSLDGASPLTHDRLRGRPGAHAAALKGIERLRAAGIFVNTATVVNRVNFQEREAIQALARRVADAVKISCQFPLGRGASADLLLSAAEQAEVHLLPARQPGGTVAYGFVPRDRCSIGSVPVVTPDGTVYPCMLSALDGLELGRFPQDSLASIWAGSPLLRQLRAVNVEEVEPCSACERRYFCAGGCRASAYLKTGVFAARDPERCGVNARIFTALLEQGTPATRELVERCRAAAARKA